MERDIARCCCVVASGSDGGGCGSFARTFVKLLTTPNQELAARIALCAPFPTLRIASRSYTPTFNASSNAVSRLDEPFVRLAERDNAGDVGRSAR